jgi:subtilisin family serine protease
MRVGAPAAWTAGNAGENTDIGIIDTGIASNHPDLAANIAYMACFTSAGSHVGNGVGACNPYPTLSDHGTHVAGTVAAVFGGGRVVGVAPKARLHSYNTFESIPGCGTCAYDSSIWLAMIDAADRGLDAINMSLGSLGQFGGRGSNELATLIAAEKRVVNYVTQRGTVIVAAAGNSNVNLNGTLIASPGDVPGVVTVGATGVGPQPRFPQAGSFDRRAFYSNYGAGVSLVAPGGDCGQDGVCNAARPANWFEHLVLSTTVAPNSACGATRSCTIGYGWKAGTSMAAPHVAGAVALSRAKNPSLNAYQVAATLTRTAQSLGDRQRFGAGMLDAAAMAR